MNDRTLTALRKSIEHWRRNSSPDATLETTSTTSDDCALCDEFNHGVTLEVELCTGCPVREKTGRSLCEKTPYTAASNAHQEWRFYAIEGDEPVHPEVLEYLRKKFIQKAQSELHFLQHLLPRGEQP